MTITTHPGQREALTDVRQRLDDLRRQRKQARDQRDSARDAFANSDHDGNVTESPLFRRAERAVAEVQRVEADIALAEAEEQNLLRGLGGARHPAGGGHESSLFDSGVMAQLEQVAHSVAPVPQMNLGPLMSRETWIGRFAGSVADLDFRSPRMAASPVVSPDSASRAGSHYGVTPQLRRQLTLLAYMSTATMDGATFPYTQESGSFTTAAEVAEGAVKAEGDVTLTDAEVKARTIAHWLKMQKQTLSDAPVLDAQLNSRLVFGVNLRLENQLINGLGTGENLLGILNVSGIGAPASGAGDSCNADQVMNGIVAVLNSGAIPTGVVLNPTDHAKMLKAKASGSGVRLDSSGAFSVDTGGTVWNVPAILNLGCPAGTGIVGDWFLGSTLFVREAPNVRVGEEQDDMTRNRVTMLGEGRFGVAWWQPSAFAKVSLGFAA